MKKFTPVFLYIKRCKITGLLYFGKTIQKDPEKYLGSGTYWQNHIKKYGKENIETLWYCLYTSEDILEQFAKNFSISNNIVASNKWANLIIETGSSYKPPPKTAEQIQKQKSSMKGRKHSLERKKTNSISHSKKCTIDFGKTVFNSAKELSKCLGKSIDGARSPNFRYIINGQLISKQQEINIHKMKRNKRCTVDGKIIFKSKKDLAKSLGYGKNGTRSPKFRYIYDI